MESTNLPRKVLPNSADSLRNARGPDGEPHIRVHGRGCLGPVAPRVLQFCVPWRRKPAFPAPLLQLLLPTDQVTLDMDGEVPQGGT